MNERMGQVDARPVQVVIGCQHGDEGKGRFTDLLCANADIVARYQSGPHSGHTVVTDDGEFRFIQLPSGMLQGAEGYLGNGCVVDAEGLVEELDALRGRGFPVKLRLSERCHVIMPYHRAFDAAREAWRSRFGSETASTNRGTKTAATLGSTMKGVGPCREDRIARLGVRLADLHDGDATRARIESLARLKSETLERVFGLRYPEEGTLEAEVDRICAGLDRARDRLEPCIGDVSRELGDAITCGKRIVFEGAQSVGLDVEHGTYPYVSSGYSAASGLFVGTGLPISTPATVFGVAKAYAVRVGAGPLPSELFDKVSDYIVERGQEYGTVTGRRRRVGWLDLCTIRRSIRLDGVSKLLMTAVDVLAGLDTVRVGTHYRVRGKLVDELPAAQRDWADLEVVYKDLPGWSCSLRPGAESGRFADLPDEARRYLDLVAAETGVEIAAVGIGPKRDETLFCEGFPDGDR